MIVKPLLQNPLGGGLGGGLAGGGNLVQRPVDENIERQYFYNKDLNKLFNMPVGIRMAAPKGFESVNKNQYEDFASKGATLQGADRFNDAMGGGYNLDLPRLTSGPNSGQVDRNSPEFLYYYGDQQKNPPPKLSLEGTSGISANVPLNNFPGNPNRKPADPANLGSAGGPSLFPTKIGGIENTAIASLPQPTEGVSQDVFGNPNYLERSVSPIVTGPEELAIASNQQIPDAGLFNRVGQQMIGYDDQFSGINNRLNKIEEGIASLVQNRGQGLNMNTGGLGYFFNPFGGFYG